MTPMIVVEVIPLGFVMILFLAVLAVGAFVADYIFPRIPFINRWLCSLPEHEDEKLYEQYLAECRARRRARQRRMAARKGRRQ